MTITTTTIQGCGGDLTIGVAFGASSFKLVVLGFVLLTIMVTLGLYVLLLQSFRFVVLLN